MRDKSTKTSFSQIFLLAEESHPFGNFTTPLHRDSTRKILSGNHLIVHRCSKALFSTILPFSSVKNARAEVYINRNRLEKVDARFDVVAIDEEGKERKIEVIRNAF